MSKPKKIKDNPSFAKVTNQIKGMDGSSIQDFSTFKNILSKDQ